MQFFFRKEWTKKINISYSGPAKNKQKRNRKGAKIFKFDNSTMHETNRKTARFFFSLAVKDFPF